MNKLFKILIVFISSIILVLSLAFIFLEGRLLFSGDWLAYDSPVMGFIRYLSRLLISIFALTKSLLEIININKEDKIKEWLYYCDFAYVLISMSVIAFSANYIGIICIALAIVNLLIKFLSIKILK